jgi:hypothetical protein
MMSARQRLIKTPTATAWNAQQSPTTRGLRRYAKTAITHIHNTVPERALAMAVSGYGCDNSWPVANRASKLRLKAATASALSITLNNYRLTPVGS